MKGKIDAELASWETVSVFVAVVPVHGGDAVQLLHAQHGAQVVGDLLQRLLVLLVDHQERHRLRITHSC